MADLARATDKMAAFVTDMAAQASASSVIGLGYSNGANILSNVMFERGLFDVAMLLHPLIPFEPKDNVALAGRQVLITAGERDPICPAPLTRRLADYFGRQKADVSLQWHPGGHELREAEIVLAQGGTVADACRRIGVTEQSYYRWRKEYGGLKMDQARRMKELEKENARLRRAVSDLTLDKMILAEAARGNF